MLLSVPVRLLAVCFLLDFLLQLHASDVVNVTRGGVNRAVIVGLDGVCDLGQGPCLFLHCLPGHTEALSTWTQQVSGGYYNNNNTIKRLT